MTRRSRCQAAGLAAILGLAWAGAGSPVLAQEAIVDTAIPFVAGAAENELMLRGPVGWPTYQTGMVDGMTYRFDPDGYARFGAAERLDKDYWEVVCTPQPVDCTGRRGFVVLRVDAASKVGLEVEDANPEGRFALDSPDAPALSLAELTAPGHVAELLAASDLVAEFGGETVPISGIGTVARYMRWVEHGQALEFRADATPSRPFEQATDSASAAAPSAPVALAPAALEAEPGAGGDGAATAPVAEGAAAGDPQNPAVAVEAVEGVAGIAAASEAEKDAVAVAPATAPLVAPAAGGGDAPAQAATTPAKASSTSADAGRRSPAPTAAPTPAASPASPATIAAPTASPATTKAGQGAAGITALVGDEAPSNISVPAFAPASGVAGGLSGASASALAAAAKIGTAAALSGSSPSSETVAAPASTSASPATAPATADAKAPAETVAAVLPGDGAACAPLPSSAMTTPVGSLRELPGVLLFVGYLSEPPALKGRLQKDVLAAGTERLKAAGIRLLTEDEIEKTPGKPRLELYLTNGDPEKGCEFRVFLSLRQEVALARDPSLHLITGTWGDGGLSRAGQAVGAELETFLYYIDRFVADYQKANSEPATTGKPSATKSKAATGPAVSPALAGAKTSTGADKAPAAAAVTALGTPATKSLASTATAPRQLVNTATVPAGTDATTGAAPSAAALPKTDPAADDAQLVQPIQVALREAGYDPGPADGIPGKRTREAILAFEQSSGMDPTGAASGAVLERLLALKPEGPRQ